MAMRRQSSSSREGPWAVFLPPPPRAALVVRGASHQIVGVGVVRREHAAVVPGARGAGAGAGRRGGGWRMAPPSWRAQALI
jgi:hypothetical protein